jgi:hypothetical protein
LHIPQNPHLSGSLVKEPSLRPPSTKPLERAMPNLQSPFIQLSKSLVEEPSSRFPKQSPYEKRCPLDMEVILS